MHMMNLNGIALHVADTGEPDLPVMVFSNSLGTDFRSWDRVVERLSGTFRLIRYDKRGHGLSAAPAAPYTMDDHVGDLEALLDGLGVKDAILVGLSVGGLIAQGIASRRPDLVKALVLCDTAARIGNTETWASRIKAIEDSGIRSIQESILERWFSENFRKEREVELAGWRAMLTRTPEQGYLGTAAALRDTDYTEATRNLSLPVLCICGDEDGATPPEVVKATAALISGARYIEIEGAGHLPCIEAPDAVVAAITAFIQENSLV